MSKLAKILLGATAALAIGAPCTNAQTIFAEDFESPVTADFITYFAPTVIVTATNTWSVTINSVDLYDDAARPEAVAFDEGQAIDLAGSPGEGSLETDFPTTPGLTYELEFYFARNSNLGAGIGMAMVEVIGSATVLQDTVKHDPLTNAFSESLLHKNQFVADAAVSTLRFNGLNAGIAGITIDAIKISVFTASGVADRTPRNLHELRSYPNPFNPRVTIEFALTKPGPASLDVYDMRGRLVKNLISAEKGIGLHAAVWNGKNNDSIAVASGSYFAVLKTLSGRSTQKLVLLK